MKLIGASLVTLGMIFSFVFFVVVMIMYYTQSFDVWIAMLFTIMINVILWLIGPWITDWINKFFYKVQFMSPEQVQQSYPHLYELIDTIRTEYNFAFPKVGIIADDNPTAFTYGSGRYNSRLIFTNGIPKYLNENEQRAVIAHEMGHIVNRDFIVMMIASTLVQLLYELSAGVSKGKGRKNSGAIIALVAYIFYFIASYLLLFLSRTRELLADRFAAERTEADDLSNALIKIAYGIVSEEDSGPASRLLRSTRHMGLVDVKNSKTAGGVSYITNSDPHAISEAMLFDAYSPWATVIELNSTHPLTGKRIERLSLQASNAGRSFSYNVASAAQRVVLDKGKLWGVFFKDIAMIVLPYGVALTAGILTRNAGLAVVGLGVGFFLKTLYRFPGSTAVESTILSEMRNPYSSPLRGRSITIRGQAVGRGVAGFVFGEDVMYQDKTGLAFVDYHSAFSIFGNLFFALKKLKTILGIDSVASGWYFRSMASYIVLQRMDVQDAPKPIRSYQKVWSLVGAVLIIALGGFLTYAQIGSTVTL